MITVEMKKEISLSPSDLIHEFNCLSPGYKLQFIEEFIDHIDKYDLAKRIAYAGTQSWAGMPAEKWEEAMNKLREMLNTDYSEYITKMDAHPLTLDMLCVPDDAEDGRFERNVRKI